MPVWVECKLALSGALVYVNLSQVISVRADNGRIILGCADGETMMVEGSDPKELIRSGVVTCA